MRFKAPYNDKRESHGICKKCERKLLPRKGKVPTVRGLALKGAIAKGEYKSGKQSITFGKGKYNGTNRADLKSKIKRATRK